MVQPFKTVQHASPTRTAPTQHYSPVQPRRACPAWAGHQGMSPEISQQHPHSGPNWEQPGPPGMCVSTCCRFSSSSFSEDGSLEDGIPLNFFLPQRSHVRVWGHGCFPCHPQGLPGGGGQQAACVLGPMMTSNMGEQMRHTPCPSRCF